LVVLPALETLHRRKQITCKKENVPLGGVYAGVGSVSGTMPWMLSLYFSVVSM
jgi:hypothetical protein